MEPSDRILQLPTGAPHGPNNWACPRDIHLSRDVGSGSGHWVETGFTPHIPYLKPHPKSSHLHCLQNTTEEPRNRGIYFTKSGAHSAPIHSRRFVHQRPRNRNRRPRHRVGRRIEHSQVLDQNCGTSLISPVARR